MKILQLTAENVKRLKVVQITPAGHLVQVTGPNGSGKTSVLDAIAWALEGTKNVQAQPVRRGAKSARVRVDLGDLVVTRRFSEAGSTLTVETKDGAKYPSPQAVLDRLLGTIAFDPLAFARMRPRDQFETLRALVRLDVDFAALDRESAADFARRTELNRTAKNLRVRLAEGPAFPADLPERPVDTRALVDEIARAGQHNADVEREHERREAAVVDAGRRVSAAEAARARAAELRRQADVEDALAEQLYAQARAARDQLAAAPPLPALVDPAEVRARLDAAERTNRLIEQKAAYLKTERQALAAETEADELTARMAARERRKRDAVAAAKLPVDGIGFGDGQVLLNDVPFEQASDAEQLRASCAIAMAMNPTLRVLRVRDGSLLDEAGLRLLAEMAEAHDYQVWVERVDTSGKVGIVMEDGAVKGAEQSEVA